MSSDFDHADYVSADPEVQPRFLDVPGELIVKLRAPLPAEAVKPHENKPFLSSIKIPYVQERLNEVFGLNGWHDWYEVIDTNHTISNKNGTFPFIVVKGYLEVPKYGIRKEAFGGNGNEDLGDAYKGACTDALSKMASTLYIGMDVYKGLVKPQEEPEKAVRRLSERTNGHGDGTPSEIAKEATEAKWDANIHVSGEQRTKFWATMGTLKLKKDEVSLLLAQVGIESSTLIPKDQFDSLIERFTKYANNKNQKGKKEK